MEQRNNLIILKGQLFRRPSPARKMEKNLPSGSSLDATRIQSLIDSLRLQKSYWAGRNIIEKALVSVYYRGIVAKSNRMSALLSAPGQRPNDTIVGAKYSRDQRKHIITHLVDKKLIDGTITLLEKTREILESEFGGKISSDRIREIHGNKKLYKSASLSWKNFVSVIHDAYSIERFGTEKAEPHEGEGNIITSFFPIQKPTRELLNLFGITYDSSREVGEDTVNLTGREYRTIQKIAPYLISMNVLDMTEYKVIRPSPYAIQERTIPQPGNEPIIGVIDTLFNEDVYFRDWVEYHSLIAKDIPVDEEDKSHGTKVDSILVDGPSLQKELDDGCGRFRVRHFGVATAKRTSISFLYHTIFDIVRDNLDIKVWNLSLGSEKSVDPNFISPIAALLDTLQNTYDVIFVVAGTNQPRRGYEEHIGSPADSINSLVVNATTWGGQSPAYTREGPALSFFTKPDVAANGGDGITPLSVYGSSSDTKGYGTSFAAPWVARKMAFLIQKMGLRRETAKALIIDAASLWNRTDKTRTTKGYGEVPIRIEDILQTKKGEIKFVLTGQSERYSTYSYAIPVPKIKGKYPFYAKATLCYLPLCSRSQGVDYTDTELDLHFGRVCENGKIKSINGNRQGEQGLRDIPEAMARGVFGKWDNVKIIMEPIPSRAVARTSYGQNDWGIDIIAHERREARKKPLAFSLVITLREMNNVNRYDEFVRYALFRNWIVRQIDINQLLHIQEKAEEEIIFET